MIASVFRACIVLVDRRRARLFSLERDCDDAGVRERFVETAHLQGGLTPDVIAAIERALASEACQRLALCASPDVLVELRDAADHLRGDRLAIDELPCDLIDLPVPAVRDQLAAYGILPQRSTSSSSSTEVSSATLTGFVK